MFVSSAFSKLTFLSFFMKNLGCKFAAMVSMVTSVLCDDELSLAFNAVNLGSLDNLFMTTCTLFQFDCYHQHDAQNTDTESKIIAWCDNVDL